MPLKGTRKSRLSSSQVAIPTISLPTMTSDQLVQVGAFVQSSLAASVKHESQKLPQPKSSSRSCSAISSSKSPSLRLSLSLRLLVSPEESAASSFLLATCDLQIEPRLKLDSQK